MQPLALADALEALEAHVVGSWWRRRGLARSLRVESFEAIGAHVVVFETFSEARAIANAHRPYRGGPVDGADNGRAPSASEIEVAPDRPFVTTRRSFVVPHTESIAQCHGCAGSGEVHCAWCTGSGRVTCSQCSGSGTIWRTRSVTHQNADGTQRFETESYSESCPTHVSCSNCHGTGQVTCSTCSGARRLVHFQRLDVTWTNWRSQRLLEHTDLPDELIATAGDEVALHEEDARVEPTPGTGAAGGGAFRGGSMRLRPDVDAAANAMIVRHHAGHPEHVLRERLVVRAVPVYEARYPWPGGARRFWVYGTDLRIHAPRFPISIGRVVGAVCLVLALVGAGVAAAFALQHSDGPAQDDARPTATDAASQDAGR